VLNRQQATSRTITKGNPVSYRQALACPSVRLKPCKTPPGEAERARDSRRRQLPCYATAGHARVRSHGNRKEQAR